MNRKEVKEESTLKGPLMVGGGWVYRETYYEYWASWDKTPGRSMGVHKKLSG